MPVYGQSRVISFYNGKREPVHPLTLQIPGRYPKKFFACSVPFEASRHMQSSHITCFEKVVSRLGGHHAHHVLF